MKTNSPDTGTGGLPQQSKPFVPKTDLMGRFSRANASSVSLIGFTHSPMTGPSNETQPTPEHEKACTAGDDMPGVNRSESIDFDAWSDLAQRDPVAFEEARKRAVEGYIATCTVQEQTQMRRWQWRIDTERRRAGVPLKACLSLSGQMWLAFDKLRGALNRLTDKTISGQSPGPAPDFGNRISMRHGPLDQEQSRKSDDLRKLGRVIPLRRP